MTREEEIRSRYEKELENMRREQSACIHDWEEVKYDPEIIKKPKCEIRWQGVDCWSEIVGYTEKKVDRWSRTCKKCGKVEYTKEQKAIKYEPNFNN